jgi:sugar (pentulose or hexulose) kinase
VLAVASHDTASAVAATPASGPHFVFVSLGTWSLVGMELAGPVLSEDSQKASFSNEAGIDGTTRYLRNVMGLWVLQELVRTWSAAGQRVPLAKLLASARLEPPLKYVIDVDDPALLAPGDMLARIVAALRSSGQGVPTSPAGVVRCVLDSLALGHRSAVADVQRLSGQHADVVHIVGGGARNSLLCQLTADACGLPVIAGPAEATAIGNLLVQARAHGAVAGDLPGLRALVRTTQPLQRYWPRGDAAAWAAAQRRVGQPGS